MRKRYSIAIANDNYWGKCGGLKMLILITYFVEFPDSVRYTA